MLRTPVSGIGRPNRDCHYSFVRPHRGLKFGRELRTPAMQAGLVSHKLSFREIFRSVGGMFLYVLIVIDYRMPSHRMEGDMAAA